LSPNCEVGEDVGEEDTSAEEQKESKSYPAIGVIRFCGEGDSLGAEEPKHQDCDPEHQGIKEAWLLQFDPELLEDRDPVHLGGCGRPLLQLHVWLLLFHLALCHCGRDCQIYDPLRTQPTPVSDRISHKLILCLAQPVKLRASLCQGGRITQYGPELDPLHKDDVGDDIEDVIRHLEVHVHVEGGFLLVGDFSAGHLHDGEDQAH